MNFFNQKGSTLIGVSMAAAIMGALALGLARFIENSEKKVKTVESNSEIYVALGELRGILSAPETCAINLLGQNASNSNGLSITNSTGKTNFAPNKKLSDLSNIQISDISLSDTKDDVTVVPGGSGDTYLEIRFLRDKKIYGADIIKRIKLMIETDPVSQITKCRAVSSGDTSVWERSSVNTDDLFFQGGSVGIGVSDPKALMHLSEGLIVGQSTNTCSVDTQGEIQYSSSKKVIEICDGTSWNAVPSSNAAKPVFSKFDGTLTLKNEVEVVEVAGSSNCNCYYPACAEGWTKVSEWCSRGSRSGSCGGSRKHRGHARCTYNPGKAGILLLDPNP